MGELKTDLLLCRKEPLWFDLMAQMPQSEDKIRIERRVLWEKVRSNSIALLPRSSVYVCSFPISPRESSSQHC